jgi:hypothetical protein
VQLFNLKDNVLETTDVAAKNPEKLEELETAYIAWNEDNVEARWVAGDPSRLLKKKANKNK